MPASGRQLWTGGAIGAVTQRFADMAAGFTSSLAVIDTDGDGAHDRIYAGDLQGRLWRFDIEHTCTGIPLGDWRHIRRPQWCTRKCVARLPCRARSLADLTSRREALAEHRPGDSQHCSRPCLAGHDRRPEPLLCAARSGTLCTLDPGAIRPLVAACWRLTCGGPKARASTPCGPMAPGSTSTWACSR